jgi:hypothetical protein
VVCLANDNQVNQGIEQMRTLKTEVAEFLRNVGKNITIRTLFINEDICNLVKCFGS